MTETAEKPYPWGRTYLYSPYKGVPPPHPPGGRYRVGSIWSQRYLNLFSATLTPTLWFIDFGQGKTCQLRTNSLTNVSIIWLILFKWSPENLETQRPTTVEKREWKNDRRQNFDKKVILECNSDGKKWPKKKPDRYHFRAIRKMLAVFRNNGNINKQNIGPTHVRSLLI